MSEAVRPVLEALLTWGNQWAPRRQTKAERYAPLAAQRPRIEAAGAAIPATEAPTAS